MGGIEAPRTDVLLVQQRRLLTEQVTAQRCQFGVVKRRLKIAGSALYVAEFHDFREDVLSAGIESSSKNLSCGFSEAVFGISATTCR